MIVQNLLHSLTVKGGEGEESVVIPHFFSFYTPLFLFLSSPLIFYASSSTSSPLSFLPGSSFIIFYVNPFSFHLFFILFLYHFQIFLSPPLFYPAPLSLSNLSQSVSSLSCSSVPFQTFRLSPYFDQFYSPPCPAGS